MVQVRGEKSKREFLQKLGPEFAGATGGDRRQRTKERRDVEVSVSTRRVFPWYENIPSLGQIYFC